MIMEAIMAAEVNGGDEIRCPESTSAFLIRDVRFVMDDAGACNVVLDVGWGTCELPWRELVDRVVS
jgi:hypothetical protein